MLRVKRGLLQELEGKMCLEELAKKCVNGKILVEYQDAGLSAGDLIWDIGPGSLTCGKKVISNLNLQRLHAVVWAKGWNSFGDTTRRQLVKFRPATPEEEMVESVMTE